MQLFYFCRSGGISALPSLTLSVGQSAQKVGVALSQNGIA